MQDGASVDRPTGRVRESLEPLRTLVQSNRWCLHFRRHWIRFDRLISAIDMLCDSEFAIEAYLAPEKRPTLGERYLALYGVYQALVVQQDALATLRECLGLPRGELTASLAAIRRHRVLSVGHPTNPHPERYGAHAAFVVQMNLGSHTARMMTLAPDGSMRMEELEPAKAAELQVAEVVRRIGDVVADLRSQELAHRRKFMSTSLAALIAPALSISVGLPASIVKPLATRDAYVGVDLRGLREALGRFAAEVARRQESMQTGFDYGMAGARRCIARLDQLATASIGDGDDSIDATAFAWALERYVRGLHELATQIDEEYAGATGSAPSTDSSAASKSG